MANKIYNMVKDKASQEQKKKKVKKRRAPLGGIFGATARKVRKHMQDQYDPKI